MERTEANLRTDVQSGIGTIRNYHWTLGAINDVPIIGAYFSTARRTMILAAGVLGVVVGVTFTDIFSKKKAV